MGASEDKTVAVSEAAQSVECPVCRTVNQPTETWCTECGFRLDATPGEAPTEVEEEPIALLISETDGRTYPLKTGENLIGRSPEADVLIPHPSVSRRHALIVIEDGAAYIEDLGSTNGTIIEGKPVTSKTQIGSGARIRLGEVILRIEGSIADVTPTEEKKALAFLVAEDGTKYSLHAGTNTLGRRSDNDVVIPDPYVSGRHAEVIFDGGSWYIKDKGSTNGTYLNDERCSPEEMKPLKDGDRLIFARLSLRFRLADTETESADEPSAEASQET
ncbi:MAG: FHA domain-containing protein [Armatimonadota bacterium]